MRNLVILLTLFISLSATAETLLVSSIAGDSSYGISIVGAYQVDDEIIITSDLESISPGGLTAIHYPWDQVEVNLPSILATHIGDPDTMPFRFQTKALFYHREQIADFDYSWGDGWVYKDVIGWLYMRNYPWLYNPELGWVWVTEAGIVSGSEESMGISNVKLLAFWLYSPDSGWNYFSPYLDEIIEIPNP